MLYKPSSIRWTPTRPIQGSGRMWRTHSATDGMRPARAEPAKPGAPWRDPCGAERACGTNRVAGERLARWALAGEGDHIGDVRGGLLGLQPTYKTRQAVALTWLTSIRATPAARLQRPLLQKALSSKWSSCPKPSAALPRCRAVGWWKDLLPGPHVADGSSKTMSDMPKRLPVCMSSPWSGTCLSKLQNW